MIVQRIAKSYCHTSLPSAWIELLAAARVMFPTGFTPPVLL